MSEEEEPKKDLSISFQSAVELLLALLGAFMLLLRFPDQEIKEEIKNDLIDPENVI